MKEEKERKYELYKHRRAQRQTTRANKGFWRQPARKSVVNSEREGLRRQNVVNGVSGGLRNLSRDRGGTKKKTTQ